jgi:radical SAM protein with 4Fe4S-binding SPASM domain
MKKEVDSIIDGHKIHLHPERVYQWQKTGDCYPLHVEIGVTNRCNQNCVFCALDFVRGKADIDKKIMLTALEDMAKCGVKSVMFGGEGEPTIHKDIGNFIQKAKYHGIDVALTTNGINFNKQLQEQCLPYLSWVKFSTDAGYAKTYSEIHNTSENSFEKLLENIAQSVQFKKKNNLSVSIGTQFLMIPKNTNEKEMEELISRLKEVKPDYLSIKPYSDHPLSEKDLIVNKKSYESICNSLENLKSNSEMNIFFRKETIERIQDGNNYPECYGLSFISLIDSKGNILPCNLFYGKQDFIYGNLHQNSFQEIWNGDKRKNILDKIKGEALESCRKGCRCDAGNRYLYRIKNPQPHDNFT